MATHKSEGGPGSPSGTKDELTELGRLATEYELLDEYKSCTVDRPLFEDKPLTREYRIKLARAVVYREIPYALGNNNPRGWAGIRNSRLWRGETELPSIATTSSKSTEMQDAKAADPVASNTQPLAASPASCTSPTLKVKIQAGDTFEVAHSYRERDPDAKIAVLNLASPMQPGGGLFNGSKAQEEALCMRSSLWAALKRPWYPWPEDAVVWTDDVMVFGDFMSNGAVRRLDHDKRWWVDIVSAAGVRRPRLKNGGKEYKDPEDERDMTLKINYIMRLCAKKGSKVVVLGALGCGSFGNPIGEVARIFRECLVGVDGEKPEEDWAAAGIEEVVFAIFDNTSGREVWKGFVEKFAEVDGVAIEE